jgi:N-acetylglucosaminyl-diphospho-decaprenol L-rhamnosyltransferase
MSITGQNLSIVIVTLKSENVIFECLDSIDPKIPVFIIENSNNLEFKNLIEKKYNNVKCTLTNKNLGMGSGNNFGIKLVKTEYVLILNPDVILEPNTLKELEVSSKNCQNFAILSPISINTKYPNYKLYPSDNFNKKNNSLFKVRSVDGYAMLFNKKIINKILEKESKNKNLNYFDENFFMYLENDDLCKRIIKNKGKIFISSKAKINHLGGKAVNEVYKDEVELSRNWHWMWSKFYYNKKHYSLLKALKCGLPNFLLSALKTAFFFIILNKTKKKIYFNRAAGFLNAAIGKRSWYRPKFDQQD